MPHWLFGNYSAMNFSLKFQNQFNFDKKDLGGLKLQLFDPFHRGDHIFTVCKCRKAEIPFP